MPTLYVENVPKELYEALRARAKQHRKSIAAEVLSLLEEHIPTAQELAARRQLFSLARRIRSHRSPGRGPFPSAEEMLRADRQR